MHLHSGSLEEARTDKQTFGRTDKVRSPYFFFHPFYIHKKYNGYLFIYYLVYSIYLISDGKMYLGPPATSSLNDVPYHTP